MDDVLVELDRQLRQAKSDIELDDGMKDRIKDAIHRSGKSLDDLDGKEFAKIIAEAVGEKDVVPVVPGGKVKNVAEGMSIDKLSAKVVTEYENLTGTNLSDDMKKALKARMKRISDIDNKTEDQIVKEALNIMDDLSFDRDKLKQATENSLTDGVPKLNDNDFHSFMKKLESKIKKKGIDVDLILKNGSNSNLSPIENAVKQKIIAKQKAKYAADPTKAAEMAKLNSGQIADTSNSEMAQMVYEALSEPGAVPVVSAPDANVQNILQEASELMRKMISVNQANIAKNKESAVGYGKVMHEILDKFEKGVQ